ncbi:hypothetical protein COO60DRAFT_1669582 [Scenedesmus sp. NREL 46B-D3]|nr:hypothetical protein COO60DRAFT_1669582 [Scenedesmus sp. NREL 46B-D3]
MLLAGSSRQLAVQAWGTEISSSVSIFRTVELTSLEYIDGKTATRCEHMVDRAGQTGSTKVNFVVTHFFIDRNYNNIPDSYCHKPGSTDKCEPFTKAVLADWTKALIPCLGYAVRAGFDIAITPHLDDGLASGVWRNAQLINPLVKFDGFSYTDIMLLPLAEAVAAVMTPSTRVWFALQGEMSAMVTAFPAEHQKLLPYIKQVILGRNQQWAPNVRLGVSTNYNKLCGMGACQNPSPAQKAAVQALYNAVDFVGMSAYPRFKNAVSDMEDATEIFNYEMLEFGIDIAKLTTEGGKELVFNEFGVGGGISPSGDQPARTSEQAAESPFFGVYGGYTRKTDPWRNSLPLTVLSDTRQYLEVWYRAAALWLKRKGGPPGVHMQSTNKEGSYRNEVVSAIIKSHNLALRGLGSIDNPGSYPTY